MRFLICVILFFLSFRVHAQLTQQRVFVGTRGETSQQGCIATLSDGKVLVFQQVTDSAFRTGTAISLHDAKLNTEWRRNYFDTYRLAALQTTVINDTVYVCGVIANESIDNTFILMLDRHGSILKYRIMEGSDNLYPYSMEAHPDGGFMLFGYNTTVVGGSGTATGRSIIRFDNNAEIVWQKKYNWNLGLWGYGKVLKNGNIVCSAGSNIAMFDGSGDLVWSKDFPAFDYFLPAVEAGDKLFFCNYVYSADFTHMLALNMDGSIHLTTRRFAMQNPGVTGLWKGTYPMVLGSLFNDTAVSVNITIMELNGSVREQLLIDNYFGYAPTGAIRDACNYDFSNTAEGPVIFGQANKQGYTLIKPGTDFTFSCLSRQSNEQQAIPTTSANFAIQQVPFNSVMLDNRSLTAYPGDIYSDSTLCYRCEPFGNLFYGDTVLCANDSVVLDLTNSGGRIKWSDGSTAVTRTIKSSGTYSVGVYGLCDTAFDTISVYFLPPLSPSVTFSPESPLPGETVIFAGKPDLGNQGVWYLGDSLAGKGPALSLIFDNNGTFPIKYTVSDSLGCTYETDTSINVRLVDFYLPDAFSPNHNDLNETWGPVGQGIDAYELIIFNRWGEAVFDEKNTAWNGIFKGKPLPPGLYIYQLRLRDIEGKIYRYKGQVWLMK